MLMSRCESSGSCSFFSNEMGDMPSLVRAMKQRYCEKDKEHCARYMIKQMINKGYTLSERAVEKLAGELENLYPNDKEKARMIMDQMSL